MSVTVKSKKLEERFVLQSLNEIKKELAELRTFLTQEFEQISEEIASIRRTLHGLK